MTEKRFEVVMNEFDEVEYIMDKVAMEDRDFAEFIDFVEDICNENEQLKQFISKIDFAIIRKYDNSLENLLDEVYDGEYENWIKKQVSRAKKLDGDVE